MKRGTVFRKPSDDYYYGEEKQKVVHAKPIKQRIARKLGDLGVGKDFVVGSEESQAQLSGELHPVCSSQQLH